VVLIIPDEQTWTMLGADPAASGIRPTWSPDAAAMLAQGVPIEYRELAIPGPVSVRQLLERDHRPGGPWWPPVTAASSRRVGTRVDTATSSSSATVSA